MRRTNTTKFAHCLTRRSYDEGGAKASPLAIAHCSTQGNVLSVYGEDELGQYQKEAHVYGSSRLGMDTFPAQRPQPGDYARRHIGRSLYELSNHLGNVLAVVTDYKSGEETSNWTVDEYDVDLLTLYDYYPFGFAMASRTEAGYRFGFNGKEKDNDEEWGNLTHYDYGFRIYNPALGRFLSVDPITKYYPENTPFAFASNSPIENIDLEGLQTFRSTRNIRQLRDPIFYRNQRKRFQENNSKNKRDFSILEFRRLRNEESFEVHNLKQRLSTFNSGGARPSNPRFPSANAFGNDPIGLNIDKLAQLIYQTNEFIKRIDYFEAQLEQGTMHIALSTNFYPENDNLRGKLHNLERNYQTTFDKVYNDKYSYLLDLYKSENLPADEASYKAAARAKIQTRLQLGTSSIDQFNQIVKEFESQNNLPEYKENIIINYPTLNPK